MLSGSPEEPRVANESVPVVLYSASVFRTSWRERSRVLLIADRIPKRIAHQFSRPLMRLSRSGFRGCLLLHSQAKEPGTTDIEYGRCTLNGAEMFARIAISLRPLTFPFWNLGLLTLLVTLTSVMVQAEQIVLATAKVTSPWIVDVSNEWDVSPLMSYSCLRSNARVRFLGRSPSMLGSSTSCPHLSL